MAIFDDEEDEEIGSSSSGIGDSTHTPKTSTKSKINMVVGEGSRNYLNLSFLPTVDCQGIESGMSNAMMEKTTKDGTYRTKMLLKEKGALVDTSTSCCSISRRWIQYSFWTILALVIQMVFGAVDWAFPDGRPACDTMLTTTTSITTRNGNICGLSNTLENSKQAFNFLAAFIIGGFIMSSVKLWLKRRQAYTSLCGATRNLLIIISSIVEDANARVLLIRWTILGFELAVMKGRTLIDSDITRDYLEDQLLLEMDEWEAMVDGDRHTTVWFWVLKKCKKLLVSLDFSGNITDYEFQTICNAVSLIRDRANDLMSCIDRDQPPPYIYVCAILININLLLIAIASGVRWAIMSFDAGGGLLIWKEPRMYVEVLLLYSFTFIFALLFDVTTILYNPFGPRSIDVKHFEVGAGIRSFAKRLAKQDVDPRTMNVIDEDDEQQRESFLFADSLMEEIDYKMSASVRQSQYTLLSRKSI